MKQVTVPDEIAAKWQGVVDIIARLLDIPVGLIMRKRGEELEVLVASRTGSNHPYVVGEKEQFIGSGLYCEQVVCSGEPLKIVNALKESQWKNNPDSKRGFISYLGYPIRLPSGQIFGTLCVLATEERAYSRDEEAVLLGFRELLESQLALLYSHALLTAQVETSPDGVFIQDENGVVQLCSQRMRNLWRMSEKDSLHDSASVLTCFVEKVADEENFCAEYLRLQDNLLLEVTGAEVLLRDGRTLEYNTRGLLDEAGNAWGRVWFFRDISDKKDVEKKLRVLATVDALTGVANRRHFIEVGYQEVERARRYGQSLCMLMVDLDHFKHINDAYGHGVGDEVLQAVALAGNAVLRETDTFGRLGGEEFGVWLPGTDTQGGVDAAERLREAVSRTSVPYEEIFVKVTVSVGVAFLHTVGGEGVHEIMKEADDALYRAKEKGRNRVEIALTEQ